MAEMKLDLDRLNDFNWSSWRFRMELLLLKENLWTTVKDAKPEVVTSAWTRNDEKARATIGLALEDSQLCHIMGAASAKEMWDRLKGYHERGSLSNKIHVLRRLCSMRLADSGSMSEHLVQASELVHRLASMGEALKEHLVVAILLSSLPERYNPLVTALEGRPEEDLKLDYVKGKLLDEWRRECESQMQDKSSEKVMKTVQTEQRRYVVRACYYCKKEGHFRRNCPMLMAERQRNQARSTVIENSQEDPSNSGSDRGVCFTTMTGGNRSISGRRWILDTGCTKHMTGSTAGFDDMMYCEEKVCLADGRTVTAKGTGKGRITGVGRKGEPIDMELRELLFVPGLSGSVLSVSRITRNGYEVLFGAKDCRIQKGGKVVAVGDKSGGLYYLRQPILA